MRLRLLRPVRLGLPAVAVLALALSGCSDPAAPVPAAPPSSSASSAPAPSTPGQAIPPGTSTAGSDGLTVRYLDDDGTVHAVPVEDFPR